MNKKIIVFSLLLSSCFLFSENNEDSMTAAAFDELGASQYASVLDTGAIGMTDSKLTKITNKINKKKKTVISQLSKKYKNNNSSDSREFIGEQIIRSLN